MVQKESQSLGSGDVRSLWSGVVGLLILGAVLVGCGGSGGGSGGSSGGTTGFTGGGTGGTTGDVLAGPGPVQGTPVASSVKYAAEDKVTAKFQALEAQGLSETDREAALLAFMKTDTDFAQTGQASDGTLWARFSDNSYYLFNDRDLPDSDYSAPPVGPKFGASTGRSSFQSRGDVPLADGKTALLFDCFNGFLGEPNDKIAGLLTKRGYTVQNMDATLENLRTVNNATVLYVSSHGGKAETYLHPGEFWSMWTDTEATAANDATYIDDLTSGRLVVFEAATGFGALGYKQMQRHYAITADWVKHYGWSFTKHSVAFMNFCWSDAGGMTKALKSIAQPAGLTLGWSNAAEPNHAWRSGLYFFDRCLGTALKDSTLPQLPGGARPFPAQQVFIKMNAIGYTFADTSEFGSSELIGAGADVQLAPSVANMETFDPGFHGASATSKLIIHGLFGANAPSKVTVGGKSVAFQYVSATEIDCDIPDDPGDGYAGPVLVYSSDEIKSNAPDLTWWFGGFEYTGNPAPTETTGKIDIDANFRCDVHKYRTEVDGDLKDPAATYARTAIGTMADWSQSAIPPGYQLGSPLSGSYPLGLDGESVPPYGTGFLLDAKVDRKAGAFNVAFNYLGTDVKGVLPSVPPVYFLIPHDQLLCATNYVGRDKYGSVIYTPTDLASFDTNLAVKPYVFQGTNSLLGTTFSVPSMVPQYAPTSDHEEDTQN